MFERITRSIVPGLGVFVAFMLAAAPAFASGTAGQGVQYPGIGIGNWQSIGSQPPVLVRRAASLPSGP